MHCKDFKDYTTWLENRNTQRYVDLKGHNQQIDGKNLLHCRRLLDMAMEIASEKTITVLRPNAEYLLKIRRGEVPLDEIIEKAEADVKKLDELYDKSDLSTTVDMGFVNKLLLEIRHLKTVEPYTESKDLPKAIIVDIDGTLAKMNGRSPFDWSRVGEDICNDVVRGIIQNSDYRVFIFSGRDEICRSETERWLKEYCINYNGLFMRPEGNQEKDAIIKRRLFEQNIRGKYFIEYILDDRNQVVEMWRSMGLTCLQVADGNF